MRVFLCHMCQMWCTCYLCHMCWMCCTFSICHNCSMLFACFLYQMCLMCRTCPLCHMCPTWCAYFLCHVALRKKQLFWTYEGVNETWNDGPNIKGLKYFHKSHSNFLFSSFKSLWQTFLLWRKATACAICFIQKSHIWIPALLKSHKCIPGAQFFSYVNMRILIL